MDVDGRIWCLGPVDDLGLLRRDVVRLRRGRDRRRWSGDEHRVANSSANAATFFVESEPVFGVVDRDQVLDELLIRLADVTPAAFLRTEDGVVVQGIVDDRIS